MRWPTWILSIAALALLLGVAAMVSRQARTTPREFFDAVAARIDEGRYDRDQTLLNLDQVLERATAAGDAGLQTEVLLRRGRILMDLGAFDRARADLLAVAQARPDDPAVEEDLVELETRAGDFAAAERRVRRSLELAPEAPEAWVRLGRLHRLSAAKAADDAAALLARVLAPSDLDAAGALVDRSIALDPAAPARAAVGERLMALANAGDEAVLQEVLRLTDRGARSLASAREAYARSLQHGFRPEALAGLIEIYRRGDEPGRAADLATSTLRRADVRADAGIGRALLQVLHDLGRDGMAAELARGWMQRNVELDAPFFELSAHIAFAAERWDILIDAAQGLHGIGTTDQQQASNFYIGYAAVQQGVRAGASDLYQLGRRNLRWYLTSPTAEPVPRARALGWHAVAVASRALGEADVEREALQGQLEAAPDPDRADGEDWLRLAELQLATPHGGYRLPEARFAQGMARLPERTAELFPRWQEIGELELASIGFDPVAVRESVVQKRIWRPSSDATPYELYRLAQIHLEAEDDLRAWTYAQRLLEVVPGFVPGLDLAIDVARAAGRERDLLALVAERLAAAGRTETITEILRGVALERLDPKDLLALMRADPESFGRIGAATALAARGARDEALALLATIPTAALADEARLLTARLRLETGDATGALEAARTVERGLAAMPGALLVAAQAAAWSGAQDDLRAVLAEAAEAHGVERATLLALADVALAAGDPRAARPVLAQLDGRATTRGGDVCLRLATAAALAGDRALASASLARAEAFPTGGATERVALLVAAHAGRLDDLQPLARRLVGTPATLRGPAAAALAALLDRGEAARAALSEARAAAAHADARWALVAACVEDPTGRAAFDVDPWLGTRAEAEARRFVRGPDGARDPRATLALLVALDDPLGDPFARAALQAADAESHGALWPAWLAADLAARRGDRTGARRALDVVLALAPDFGPAWTLAEALRPELARDPAAFARFRAERLAALGEQAGAPAEVLEDRARALQAAGDHVGALAACREALQQGPARPADLQHVLGRSLLALGRADEAVQALARALGGKPAVRDRARCVEDLGAAIESARAATPPMPAEAIASAVAQVAAASPDDPRLVLLQARLDLGADPRNPALGVQRALSRLEGFRAARRGAPLDAAAPGSTAAWTRFLAAIDPARAEALAREELALAPGDLAAWLALAEALEAGGDRAAALTELRRLQRIRDDGAVGRQLLRVAGAGDMTSEEIAAGVSAVVRAEGRAQPDATLRLTAARAYLNQGPRPVAFALKALDPLLGSGALPPDERRRALLLTGIARITRGTPEDLQVAQDVLARVDCAQDAPLQDFVLALRGIAAQTAKP